MVAQAFQPVQARGLSLRLQQQLFDRDSIKNNVGAGFKPALSVIVVLSF
jgi:hypothetical protein